MRSWIALPVRSRAGATARARGALHLVLIAALLGPGAAGAGVDVWTDNGPLNPSASEERLDIYSLALDPRTSAVEYAVARAHFGSPGDDEAPQLWRTTDEGVTWSRWLPELTAVPRQVVADPHRPGRIYVCTDAGLYAWDEASGAPRRISARAFRQLFLDAEDPARFYAADETTIFRSRDAGRHWREALRFPLLTGLDFYVIHDVFTDPALPGRVYASVELFITGAETGSSLYRSDDHGTTWTPMPDLGGFDVRLSASRRQGEPTPLFSSAGHATYRSTDGGVSWDLTDFPGGLALVVPGDPATLYVASDHDLFRSRDDGTTWTLLPLIDAGPIDWRRPLAARPVAPEHLFLYFPGGSPLFEAHLVEARPLTLRAGRFVARAAWNDTRGAFGAAHPSRLSPETGLFTLPGRRRLLAAIEVLDGASEEDPLRLVGAGVLPMDAIVTVVDCRTGLLRDLVFPPGRAMSHVDGETFPPRPMPHPLFRPPPGCPDRRPAAVGPAQRGGAATSVLSYSHVRSPRRSLLRGDPAVRARRWPMSRAVPPSPPRGAFLSLLLVATLADAPPAAAGVDRWTPAGPEGVRVASLVLDPFEPRTGYALSYGAPGSDGVVPTLLWRTTDAGVTWSRWLPRLPAAASTVQVAPDPHRAGRIYLVTRLGLYVREREGAAWEVRWPARIDALAFDAGTPGLLYAANDTTLLWSANRGWTWYQAKEYTSGTRLTDLLSDPAMPGRVYASMRFPVTGGEGSAWLERSDDGGRTWEEVSSWSYSAPDFLLAPAAAAGGGSVVYTPSDRSTDGGETWEPTGFPGAVVLAVPGAPSTLYVQGSGGAFRSRDDGAAWRPIRVLGEPAFAAGGFLLAHPAAPERIFRGSSAGLETAQVVGSRPLLLQGGRFEARVAWRDAQGHFGAAQPLPVSDAGGVFALPGRERMLAALDVLDERAGAGGFRVVGASVLPMEATVTVTDLASEVSRDLYFPPSRALSLVDARSAPAGPGALSSVWSDEPAPREATCVPGAERLCLLGGRYQVSVSLQDGPSGPRFAPLAAPAPVEPLLWESGIAWFADPDVPSLVVQMVDGTSQNGSVWVLIGGLAEEGYVVRVADTVTGVTRRYVHLAGAPASVADLEAF